MSTPFVQSVLRALDVVEAVAASGSGLTLTELSDDLGLKAPTAFNLARTLVSRGYLEKTSRPVRYVLGPSLQLLSAYQGERGWLLAAEGCVRRLFEDLGDATVLVVESTGGQFVPRLRIDPLRPAVLEHVVNRHLSPYSAAVSLCLQAFWPSGERDAFRRRYPFGEYGQGAWSDVAELDEFLSASHACGYVLLPDSLPVRAAAPVWSSDGRLLGCIGASLSQDGRGLASSRIEDLARQVSRAATDLGAYVRDSGRLP